MKILDKYKVLSRIEYILALAAVVGLFMFVYLNMSYELKDPDIWLHLKTGEYIAQHGDVPKTDVFSSALAGKEWIDHSWLVQVIFYLVFHFGGADNLILLSAVIVTMTFLLLFLTIYKGREYLVLNAALLFIAIFASRQRFNIRPENFSILFFAFYLFILTKRTQTNWVFLLPFVQLAWVNCHGFFILGPLLLGVILLAEALKRTEMLPCKWSETGLLDKRACQNLTAVFLLACLACFINPYGYNGVIYPLKVFLSSGGNRVFYNNIVELTPTWVNFRAFSAYYLLIALSLGVFILNLKRINLAYFIMWSVLLTISLPVNRNIIFFNLFAFLTASEGLTGLRNNKTEMIERFFGKSLNLMKYLLKFSIIAILILWGVRNNNAIARSRYYIFDEYRLKSSLLGTAAGRYPDKAADFILKHDLPQNIFNMFNEGSYLIYRLYPDKKVFIDGRTELYGADFFNNYQKILAADKEAINNSFKKYGVNTVLLTSVGPETGDLYGYLSSSREWTVVYLDSDSLIFLKDAPENKALIGRLKVDFKKFKSGEADLDKIGLRNVFPEPYINRAWMLYYLGLDEAATKEAKEALRVLPSCSDAYNIIGRIYLRQKSYEKAFETLRLASIYGPFNTQTLISMGSYYTQTDKYEDAVKVYKKLVKTSPRFAEGFYLLSRAQDTLKDTKSALRNMRTAVKLGPFISRYYKGLGELLQKNNDFKGAIEVYEDAINKGLDTSGFKSLLNNVRSEPTTKE